MAKAMINTATQAPYPYKAGNTCCQIAPLGGPNCPTAGTTAASKPATADHTAATAAASTTNRSNARRAFVRGRLFGYAQYAQAKINNQGASNKIAR